MKTTIICCYYNEIDLLKAKLVKFINFIQKSKIEIEIIIVDNNSTDGTKEFLKDFIKVSNYSNIFCLFNDKNLGKGGSIKKACEFASGKIICVFDIDEYEFEDLITGIIFFNKKKLDLLIGYRILENKKFIYKKNLYGVIVLTKIINLLFKTDLTDSAGATKIFKLKLFKSTKVHTSGFDFEFELICKFAKEKFLIGEYPIKYEPRTYEEGKKINPWKDGIKILFTIIRSYFV